MNNSLASTITQRSCSQSNKQGQRGSGGNLHEALVWWLEGFRKKRVDEFGKLLEGKVLLFFFCSSGPGREKGIRNVLRPS